jgi:hypothetical protein
MTANNLLCRTNELVDTVTRAANTSVVGLKHHNTEAHCGDPLDCEDCGEPISSCKM